MKTAVFSPCYLDGLDPSGSPRLERTLRWIDWNTKLNLGDLWLADNASSRDKYWEIGAHVYNEAGICIEFGTDHINMHRFSTHLARGEGPNHYPYCWRAVWFMRKLIQEEYKKIILIDTDGFILSERLREYIKEADTGWEAFWVPKYQFPAAELQILNEDAFPHFLEFTSKHWNHYVGQLMEVTLPFTKINKDFNTDRFGETNIVQTAQMDAYFQASTSTLLVFDMKKNKE